MKKYILIGLSTISVSLVGMNTRNGLTESQGNIGTIVLKPLGGTLNISPTLKDDIYREFNINAEDTVQNLVHYTLDEHNDLSSQDCEILKYRARHAVPLNLFTEPGKFYIFSSNNRNIKIISDQTYNAEKFDTFTDYWKNIHNKTYTYDQYLKKISNNQ